MATWVKNLYKNEAYGNESDDELPEVVSTTEMKCVREVEISNVRENKRKMQEARKGRKKLTMEKFLSEKKTKTKTPIISESSSQEVSTGPSLKEIDRKIEPAEANNNMKKFLKSYPTLNIKIQPLEKISNSRAKRANNFKMSRLAKVNREDVSKGIISYNEKLAVKNSNCRMQNR